MVTGVRQFPLEQGSSGSNSTAGRWPFLWGPENALIDVMISRLLGGSPSPGPITLHGASGTGKSLLLHHLMDQWNALSPSRAAHGSVTTARDWAHDVQYAAADKRLTAWRAEQRKTAGLGLDDVDRLSRFPTAERELVLLLDDLMANGIPLIMTTRAAPASCQLSAALTSRLVGGWSIPIHMPQEDTRRRFISRVAEQHDWTFDESAVDWLAQQLRGSFLDIQSQMSTHLSPQRGRFSRQQVRVAFQRHTLPGRHSRKDATSSTATVSKSLKQLTKLVTGFFQISAADLKGKSRRRTLVRARCIACHVARQQLGLSYYEIAKWLGNRDHSTIIHACKQAQQIIPEEPELAQIVADLSAALREKKTS